MKNFSTEYRDQTAKNDVRINASKDLHEFYDGVTVAGKARYLPQPKDQDGGWMPIVMP